MRAVQKNLVLTDKIQRELSNGYGQLDEHYETGALTADLADLAEVAKDAREAIGLLCGSWVPLSDGEKAWAQNGFMENYGVESDADIAAAVERYTCEACWPNFLALVEADRAHGHLRALPAGE